MKSIAEHYTHSIKPAKVLTKEEFCIEYVLRRALIVEGGFTGPGAMENALSAWKMLEKEKE